MTVSLPTAQTQVRRLTLALPIASTWLTTGDIYLAL